MDGDIALCIEGEHRWEEKETFSKGKNILGSIVECYGFDMECRTCGVTSWRINDEKNNKKTFGKGK